MGGISVVSISLSGIAAKASSSACNFGVSGLGLPLFISSGQQVLSRLRLSAEVAITTRSHPVAELRRSWHTISLHARSSHQSEAPRLQPLSPRGGSVFRQPSEAGRQALGLARS